MYDVKIYKDDYDRVEFYTIMGKFFAERFYRKKMPYLVNFKNKIWFLFFQNNEVVGFCGIKPYYSYIEFTDIYVEDSYKNSGLFEYMCKLIFKEYNSKIIKVVTKIDKEIDYWTKIGFELTGLRGNYKVLTWEPKDE